MALPLRAEIYEVTGATPEVRALDANTTLLVTGRRAAADAGVDVVIRSNAVRVAGDVFAIRNTVTDLVTVDFAGDTTFVGAIIVDDVTNSVSPVTGSIQTDGGLGVVLDSFLGGNLDVAGLSAFGDSAAITVTRIIQVLHDFGEADANVTGVFVQPLVEETTGATAATITGIVANPQISNANSQNWTNAIALRGIQSSIRPGTGVGVITAATAYYAGDASGGAAVLTRNMGMFVEPMTLGVDDNIGIWIEEPSGGATLNDAIHVVGGRSFFGDVVFAGNAPSAGAIFGSGVELAYSFVNPTAGASGDGALVAVATYQETAGASSRIHSGGLFALGVDAANTQNWTATGNAAVYVSLVNDAGAAGTMTHMSGIFVDVAFAGAAIWTNHYGIRIASVRQGTTNNFGIWIDEPLIGATLNDAIHVVGGRSFFGGTAVVGSEAPFLAFETTLTTSATFTNPGGNDKFGIIAMPQVVAISGPTTGDHAGCFGVGIVGAANTQNVTSIAGVSAQVWTANGSAGVVTRAQAYLAQSALVFGATITRAMGMLIEAQTVGVTDNIGIWIETPAGGGGLSDAIHVVGGRTFIGGAIHIAQGVALGGGAAPVVGTIGGAGPAVAAQNEWLAITTQNGAGFVPVWQ